MKRHLVLSAVLSAALLCGFSFTRPEGQDPAAQRIEKAEKDLAASRLRVEALAADVVELRKELASTLHYLEVQSKSAAAMAAVLDESEKAGFTYGLNPDSRHILLRGWREQLAAAQKDLPVAEISPEKPTPPKPPTRGATKPPEKAGD